MYIAKWCEYTMFCEHSLDGATTCCQHRKHCCVAGRCINNCLFIKYDLYLVCGLNFFRSLGDLNRFVRFVISLVKYTFEM